MLREWMQCMIPTIFLCSVRGMGEYRSYLSNTLGIKETATSRLQCVGYFRERFSYLFSTGLTLIPAMVTRTLCRGRVELSLLLQTSRRLAWGYTVLLFMLCSPLGIWHSFVGSWNTQHNFMGMNQYMRKQHYNPTFIPLDGRKPDDRPNNVSSMFYEILETSEDSDRMESHQTGARQLKNNSA